MICWLNRHPRVGVKSLWLNPYLRVLIVSRLLCCEVSFCREECAADRWCASTDGWEGVNGGALAVGLSRALAASRLIVMEMPGCLLKWAWQSRLPPHFSTRRRDKGHHSGCRTLEQCRAVSKSYASGGRKSEGESNTEGRRDRENGLRTGGIKIKPNQNKEIQKGRDNEHRQEGA